MNDLNPPIFIKDSGKLSLLDHSGEFHGLEKAHAPELVQRVRDLFNRLNQLLGFADNEMGTEQQRCFHLLARNAYPEILIDLADKVYVQHERPMVVLNFEHLNANLHADPLAEPYLGNTGLLSARLQALFEALAETLRKETVLFNDTELVRSMAEGYSHYLYDTKNFPWEEPIDEERLAKYHRPVLDVATGLAGFSLIHNWPQRFFPKLILSDSMPFIVESLNHYKGLSGHQNVEVVQTHFPDSGTLQGPFSSIWANKFLHHMQRPERQEFLKWVHQHLEVGGNFSVIDTDLEVRILESARNLDYAEKLIPGYLETLVNIEPEFCRNLMEDIGSTGFLLTGFETNEYLDETDAYSQYPGDNLDIQFTGVEVNAQKIDPPEKADAD